MQPEFSFTCPDGQVINAIFFDKDLYKRSPCKSRLTNSLTRICTKDRLGNQDGLHLDSLLVSFNKPLINNLYQSPIYFSIYFKKQVEMPLRQVKILSGRLSD